MNKVKITAKLIITIVVVALMSMLCFELAYNSMLYKDYAELDSKVMHLENTFELHTKLLLQFIELQKGE